MQQHRNLAGVETQEGIPLLYLLVLLYPAQARGHDIDTLLRQYGLPTTLQGNATQDVSLLQFARVMRRLQRALRDEMMGVCSRAVRPGTFLLVARQMLLSPSLGDALRVGCSLYRLAIDEFSPRLRTKGEVACLEIVDNSPAGTYRSTGHLILLYGAIGLMSWLVQRPIAIHEVSLRQYFLDGTAVSALFQAPVCPGNKSRITFDASHLDDRVVTDLRGLRSFLLHWPARRMALYSEDMPVAIQVRKRLYQWDVARLPTSAELAATMGLTDKGLRRKLFQEGQSFRAIIDGVRRDAAIRLLDQSRLTVAEIGIRLGFSEPSAFHRAFRRSTGLTPVQYRRQDSGRAD